MRRRRNWNLLSCSDAEKFMTLNKQRSHCTSHPHMATQVKRCLSIKGAEDIINRPHSFEISTTMENMFFIADTEKVRHMLTRGCTCVSGVFLSSENKCCGVLHKVCAQCSMMSCIYENEDKM